MNPFASVTGMLQEGNDKTKSKVVFCIHKSVVAVYDLYAKKWVVHLMLLTVRP